jgi:hypothetical protein
MRFSEADSERLIALRDRISQLEWMIKLLCQEIVLCWEEIASIKNRKGQKS